MEKKLFGAQVQKALTEAQGSNEQMVDISDVILERRDVQPKLLTALLGSTALTDNLVGSNAFRFDERFENDAVPIGKRYDSDSKMALDQDEFRSHLFSVPSFGTLLNTKPKDWSGKRRPGTAELQDEAYVTSQLMRKADRAYMLLTELMIRDILITDTNYVGGFGTGTNFYTEIVGSARPAAQNLSLDTTAQLETVQAMQKNRQLLITEVEKTRDSMDARPFVICGDTFFNQRWTQEAQATLARDLKGTLDLQSMQVPESNYGSGTFPYFYFESMDGCTYVNYGATILSGQKLIADTDAYMVPIGTQNLIGRAFAPAQDMDYVNTEAQERYAWTYTDRRNGVTVIEETNKLVYSRAPRYIIRLTTNA